MMPRWLSFLSLFWLCPPALAAEEAARVLILPFENATGMQDMDGLADGTADLLTICFSHHDSNVEVVDRGNLDQILMERGMGWEGLLNDDASMESLALSGAQYVIRGSLRGNQELLVVHAFLHDLASTRLIRSHEAAGPASVLPERLCDLVAKDLSQGFGTENIGDSQFAEDDSPLRSQLLIVGIGHYYNGNFGAAFPAFLKLMRSDPSDGEAQFWLARSFHEAGLSELAEAQVRRFLDVFPNDRNRERAMLLLHEIETARQP